MQQSSAPSTDLFRLQRRTVADEAVQCPVWPRTNYHHAELRRTYTFIVNPFPTLMLIISEMIRICDASEIAL